MVGGLILLQAVIGDYFGRFGRLAWGALERSVDLVKLILARSGVG